MFVTAAVGHLSIREKLGRPFLRPRPVPDHGQHEHQIEIAIEPGAQLHEQAGETGEMNGPDRPEVRVDKTAPVRVLSLHVRRLPKVAPILGTNRIE